MFMAAVFGMYLHTFPSLLLRAMLIGILMSSLLCNAIQCILQIHYYVFRLIFNAKTRSNEATIHVQYALLVICSLV